MDVPFHPVYTYHWGLLDLVQFAEFAEWLCSMKIIEENGELIKIILPLHDAKRHGDLIGIPCLVTGNEFVVYGKDTAVAIFETFGATTKQEFIARHEQISNTAEQKLAEHNKDEKMHDRDLHDAQVHDKVVLSLINSFSGIKIMDKSGTFIGARMGRPEKSKMRRLSTSPHCLFPIGDAGGRLRSFQSAMETGEVSSAFPIYACSNCNTETILAVCEKCSGSTTKVYNCSVCGYIREQVCLKHGPALSFRTKKIRIADYFTSAAEMLKMKAWPDVVKGVRGTSNRDHIPEHIAKGLLRAKYDLFVNKDGTTRYDMTELPMTHFKPKEIGVSVERLKELGYAHDIHGREITEPNQILELKPQD
ncbi:hypothetical protein FJZ26_06265, partial [Candidatus Parvarchaeota archaeon]|nr:hypothetical protein [Candidatus Parvarchaeota archaeon]